MRFTFFLLITLVPSFVCAQLPVMIFHAHTGLGYSTVRFTESMDFLKDNGYHTVTPDQLLDWMEFREPLPLRPILLTVDDNYIKVYTEMYPLLQERGQFMVNFTTTDYVGVDSGNDHADWVELQEMEDTGVMTNESHTESHRNLADLSPTVQHAEIFESMAALNADLENKNCQYIAYPYGGYDDNVLIECNLAGYRAGFSTIGGMNYPDTNIYEIRRVSGDTPTLAGFVQNIGFNQLPPPPPGEGWTIDNKDVNFYCDVPEWLTSTSMPDNYGGNYRYTDSTEVVPAKWAAYLPQTGAYRLHAYWPTSHMYDTQATFRVTDTSGQRDIVVDQSVSGGEWMFIGTASFSTDVAASIELIPSGNGYTVADGLWFEPVVSQVDGWLIH
jgi:peptidoglycan/xylan/chitin deacetylase (PgdA/CDA1 family)